MFTLNDEVLRAQRCYRTLLEALSKPGSVVRLDLPTGGKIFVEGVPRPLALACECLVDEKVTIAGLKERGRHWAREIAKLLRVRMVAPDMADFVLTGADITAGDMSSLKNGSLLAPEEGATLFVYVEELISGDFGVLSMEGPGVRGKVELAVSEAVLKWAWERKNVCLEYPMGFEAFLFDSEGNVVGIPRSCSVDVSGPKGG